MLYQDFSEMLYGCSHNLTKKLFKEGKVEAGGFNTKKRPPSLASQFKASVGGK